MIGHHCRGKSVACRGDKHAGKLGVEKVGVCGDGGIETGLPKGKQCLVLLWSRLDKVISRCRALLVHTKGESYGIIEERVIIRLKLRHLQKIVVTTAWCQLKPSCTIMTTG